MKCDSCGAPIENGKCTYCGKTFITDDVKPQYQSGQQTTVVNNVYTTQVVEKEKSKITVGKVLLWIFFFPIMATIAVWKSHWKLWIKILVTVVMWLIFFGYAANSKSETDTTSNTSTSSTQTQTQAQTTKVEENKIYTIGETAENNGVQITLANVMTSYGKDFVKPDDGKKYLGLIFDISNNSGKDITISSIVSFEAYCDDYSVDMDLIGLQADEWNGYDQVDGTVASGKKLMGVIVYQVPENFSEFEINCKPNFWSGKDLTFVFTADQTH